MFVPRYLRHASSLMQSRACSLAKDSNGTAAACRGTYIILLARLLAATGRADDGLVGQKLCVDE